MSKGIKITKKARFEGARLGKREKSIPMQEVMERPDVSEIIVCGLVLLLLTTGTYLRNRIWNSDVGLWADCVKKSPNKERPHYNLGEAFVQQGRYPEAITHFTEALRINPNYEEAHIHLG
jgi:tetratricopeptide (TPR) repeat protein